MGKRMRRWLQIWKFRIERTTKTDKMKVKKIIEIEKKAREREA
jgi:hypothetical protein